MSHERYDRPAEGDYKPSANDAGEHGDVSPDELRVSRGEEELRTGARRRQAGSVNVRKSVHTDREEFRVPKRREEVEIERVPGERQEAPETEIGGDEEVVVPVYEEEVVVTKRLVLKEEIRLRKEVIEEEEIVEEDVRREEVEIDDQTERGSTERGGETNGSESYQGERRGG